MDHSLARRRFSNGQSVDAATVSAVVIGSGDEMVDAASLAVPYLPHQRVIVFQADLMSGDTLGYHGTIVRLHAASHRQYPHSPERWIYRVSIPCLRCQESETSTQARFWTFPPMVTLLRVLVDD